MVFRIDQRLTLRAAAVVAALLLPAAAGAGEARSLADLLGLPGRDEPARLEVAQSAEAAQLTLRIQQLEEQIRNLTGQVEGLQFQLTQMQTLLESQNQANEARLQRLEGGAEAKPEAEAEGATPPGELPQEQAAADPNLVVPEGGVNPSPDAIVIDPTFGEPMDALGESQDPLLGTGEGAQPVELGSLPAEQPGLEGRPLDLSLDGVAPANGDAVAQYAAGYDAIVRGDYAFAEEQFSQFLALYPDDPQAADATNWWGEALLQRGAYDEATDVLFTGFQTYPDSPRAPDILLKLGIALVGAEERDTACRTFAEVPKRYTNLSAAFLARLAEEVARAQCPPAG